MNGLFLGEIGLPGVAQSVGVARRCVEEILSTGGMAKAVRGEAL